jgi:predicted RNA-binding protein (virulence factor B family)
MKKNDRDLKLTVASGVFTKWQEVDIVAYQKTDLGYKVAINNEYAGLIYNNEIFAPVRLGIPMKGYIKAVRDDYRIDVTLQPQENTHVELTAYKILNMLADAGGKLAFGDSSSPDDIKRVFGVSKKVFKKSIGILYKQKKIIISGDGIKSV